MDSKKKMTGMLIHGFAIAHAATAALLAQTFVGDEAALTALTVAMIVAVAKMNGADWDSGSALAFLGVFIGGYVGTRGATFLIKWIPGIGNAANAAVTFTTTEILGWATYLFVREGKTTDPKKITNDEKEKLWKEASSIRNQERYKSQKLYESMSSEDKKEYNEIISQLRKDLPDKTRTYLLDRLETILKKYS